MAQVNAEQVMNIGVNVLSMDDYMLSIQYFNQAIKAKPYMADPWYYRAVAKLYLEDYKGAEEDCTAAIERNKFKTESYKVRGFARQYLGKDSLAIGDYNVGLEYNPQDKYFLYYKSIAQTAIKDYPGADSTFNRLLKLYPNFDAGFSARGRLRVLQGDTVAAIDDATRAIELSRTEVQPYLLRAEIEFTRHNWKEALADMDEAIRLKPHEDDLYLNRAYVRYNLDDYFGAMADYNYALELNPYSSGAMFNRALLRYEVKDLDRSAADFEGVLKMQPDNFHAIYNLGLVNLERGKSRDALKDFQRIAAKYPRFYPVYYAQAEAYRDLGDMRSAMACVHRADQMVKGYVKDPEKNPLDRPAIVQGTTNTEHSGAAAEDESADEVMDRFNQLVTVGSESQEHLSYNDRIRGRVQDRDIPANPEPSYALSFTAPAVSLKSTSNWFRELDDFNSNGYIPQRIWLSLGITAPEGEDGYNQIFTMAEIYDKIATEGKARPADWLALGITKTMLKDYDAAITALDKAAEGTPDLSMVYMARAYAHAQKGAARDVQLALADYDRALQCNPRLVYAWHNKGDLYYNAGDYTSALECYSKALAIDPELGAALFNRGLTYLRMGNKRAAFADLGKAGELGVIPSYNLLKRMK